MNIHSPLTVALVIVAMAILYFVVWRAGKKKLAADKAAAELAARQTINPEGDDSKKDPEVFDDSMLPGLAAEHSSTLVRQLADALIKEKQLPPRIRTIHYVRLRQFVSAVSPDTLAAYDKLHKAPKGQKEREALLASNG